MRLTVDKKTSFYRKENFSMQNTDRYLLFTVDEQVLAVNIEVIERIIKAIKTTHLPDAPENITGIINFQDEIIPVLNLRKQFSLPDREAGLSEDFMIVKTSSRTIVIVVDAVSQVIEIPPEKIVPARNVLSQVEYVRGFGRCEEGIIIILDLENLLKLNNEEQITSSMDRLLAEERAL